MENCHRATGKMVWGKITKLSELASIWYSAILKIDPRNIIVNNQGLKKVINPDE
jgi:hypothetical protein